MSDSIFKKTTSGINSSNNSKTMSMAMANNTATPVQKYSIGCYVIARCRDAGVHFGKLVDYHDRTAVLEESRRIWSWIPEGTEATLSACAREGVTSMSKIAGQLPGEHVLLDCCELLPCTDVAIQCFKNHPIAVKSS